MVGMLDVALPRPAGGEHGGNLRLNQVKVVGDELHNVDVAKKASLSPYWGAFVGNEKFPLSLKGECLQKVPNSAVFA